MTCLQLPAAFQDFVVEKIGTSASAVLVTFCRRQLMHAAWSLLLDDDFCHAYEHGTVIECSDGVFRRVYPRIMTYAADYPEK
jgi:hypothetical protein